MSFFEPPQPPSDMPEPAFERKPWWGEPTNDGGGGGDRRDQSLWLWPLPPPGPVPFVVEWPSEGIRLTRHEVDAEPMLEATRSSTKLWPEPRAGAAGAAGITSSD